MALETATFISQLDKLAPLSGDQRKQGDDHLRLIKGVLKATFPGKNGQGFAKAITATEDEINMLSAATANSIQSQLNNLKVNWYAPVGTVAIVYQAAAPAGWVNVGFGNNFTLVTAGATGGGAFNAGNGDIVTGCTVVASHTHIVDPATISTSIASAYHAHTYIDGFTNTEQPLLQYPGENLAAERSTISNSWFGGNGWIHNRLLTSNPANAPHSHTVDMPATTTTTNTGAAVWKPKYITVIGIRKS